MTTLQKFLNALLKLQSAITLPQSAVAALFKGREHNNEHAAGFILGQGALIGQRLYLAKANLTACEVISVYNAAAYLKRPAPFLQVKREFFRRGALTLFWFGFFGGNPYSIGRVLKGFKFAREPVSFGDMNRNGAYIMSFWNGATPTLHTVFCTRSAGKWTVYNLHSNDHRPMPFDTGKYEDKFIHGWRIGDEI